LQQEHDRSFEEELKKIAQERRLTPCHAFFASFLASLSEAGVLNQAIVNFMAKHAASIIRGYLKALNLLKVEGESAVEKFKSLVVQLNKALEIGDKVGFKVEDARTVYIGVGGSSCRYCPRGVGRAEIPGTACPFPRLIEALARMEGIEATYTPIVENGQPKALKREGGLCWIKYKLG